jgi:hypothetical protein
MEVIRAGLGGDANDAATALTELRIVNSWTLSGENETASRASPTPVLLMPSASRFMLPARPPLACRLKPGSGVPEPSVGSDEPTSPVTLPTVMARSRTLRVGRGVSSSVRSVMV